MYEIIKNVIAAGGYKLADIQYKVRKLYILGDLTEAQTDELLALAVQGISTDAERPELLAMIQSLAAEVAALKDRLDAQGGTTPEPSEYPAWKPWDGISKDYQYGAVVSHNGQLWRSEYQGQNVWEPGTIGTESLWVPYTPDNKEE